MHISTKVISVLPVDAKSLQRVLEEAWNVWVHKTSNTVVRLAES